MNSIEKNFLDLKNQIAASEKKFQRAPGSVALLAVTKKQPIEKIAEAIAAGQKLFGENYLQEALEKITHFADHNLEWHFIGPIQSNKTKKIAENFQWVQSVADKRIAQRLNDQRPSHLPALNICLEVNISAEKSKAGVQIEDTLELAEYCLTLPKLKLRGLMAIPEPHSEFEKQRAEFHKLKVLFEKIREQGILIDTLSMGMSGDWEAAISEGSNLIRIGTALFGARN